MSPAWERFTKTLTLRGAKFCAAGPLIAADHAAFLSGIPVSKVVTSAQLLTETLTKAQAEYGGDFLIVFADVNVEAEAMGCRLEFPTDAPPHLVQTCPPDQLKRTDPDHDSRLPMMVEATRNLVKELGNEVPVFASLKDPFSAATLACGTEYFLSLLIENPTLAQEAIQVTLDNQLRYLQALLAVGANIIVGAPLASGGILGPAHFRQFAFEPLAQLLAAARQQGRWTGLHVCGEANPILAQLVQTPAHFLSLESFEVARWRELTANGSRGPALMGYLSTNLLLSGSAEPIEAEVQREIESLVGCPHLLSTACDVPQHSPPQNIHAFMRAARAISES